MLAQWIALGLFDGDGDVVTPPVDNGLPAPIKTAILLMVGDMYRRRDTTADVVTTAVPMSTTVAALLAPYRRWSV